MAQGRALLTGEGRGGATATGARAHEGLALFRRSQRTSTAKE